MMERKATKPGVSRLDSDPGKPVVIPIEGKANYLKGFTHVYFTYFSNCETEYSMLPHFLTEFPAPKNELFQRFNVYYLGSGPVAKPVGKRTRSDIAMIYLITEVVCALACYCIFLFHYYDLLL